LIRILFFSPTIWFKPVPGTTSVYRALLTVS
jgi:hypothetical protein